MRQTQHVERAKNSKLQENDKDPRENDRPREKLQSQLNTIMPMEIVRAQPFFSRQSHTLRDQMEEYVSGFPATRAHRQIIAKAFNMQNYEIEEPPADTKKNIKTPKASTKKDYSDAQKLFNEMNQHAASKNQGEMLIPDQDLPVDPDRLKKAIKTALIKNENNPDKIDI